MTAYNSNLQGFGTGTIRSGGNLLRGNAPISMGTFGGVPFSTGVLSQSRPPLSGMAKVELRV